jgi:hypothetical protein
VRINFSRLTAGLDLSPAAGQIKESPRYCRVAHHLARLWIHFFHQPHVRLRSSVNPATTIVGGNRGESGVPAALGDISCPHRPSGACRLPTMMIGFIGSNFSPFIHCIITYVQISIGAEFWGPLNQKRGNAQGLRIYHRQRNKSSASHMN